MTEEGKITGITSGMYSGVDWVNSIIPQLVAIEGKRIDLWKAQKAKYKLEQDTWRDVNMRFSNLKDKSYGLLQDSTWEKVSITSSDETYLKATDAGGAVAGTYDFRVWRLATASTLRSSATLNTHASRVSQEEVMSGINTVDLNTITNTWTQFDVDVDPNQIITVTTSEGTTSVWLGGVNTINKLMSAVSTLGTANVLMRYDSQRDRFIIETKRSGGGGELTSLTSTVTTGNFWQEAKLAPSTGFPDTTNETGIDPAVKLSNANFDTPLSATSGSFKINGVTINWTNSNTLNGIMSAINTSAAAGVNAFYDESMDRVLLTHKYGGPRSIDVYDIQGNLANVLKIHNVDEIEGNSAIFTINSTNPDDKIGKDSNTFTIAGTTFTLKKTNVTMAGASPTQAELQAATPVTVSVAKDINAIKTAINDWVTQWNSTMGFLKTSMHYDNANKKSGPLTGSVTAIGIQQRMYTITTDRYTLLPPSMNQLAHIGITLGAFKSGNEGRLVVDDAVLTKALTDRLQDVENLFGMSTTGGNVKDCGVAYKIYEYTGDLTKGTGVIANQIELYSNPKKTGLMDMLDKQIADYQEYIEKYRKRLQTEFEAMEITISQMKAQLNYLSGYTAKK